MRDSKHDGTRWAAWISSGSERSDHDGEPSELELMIWLDSLDRIPEPDLLKMRRFRSELVRGPSATIGDIPQPSSRRSAKGIRVLIVEREQLFRRGLAGCLATDDGTEVIASASAAEEGYRLADEHLPDVVLVGTTLADAPGLSAATEFRRRFPSIATIVVAAQETDDELFAAIRAGASAYCGQDIEETKLIRLIKRASTGEYVINEQLLDKPYVAARVLEQFRSATASELAPTSAFAPLTDRELEILKKVSDGLTNAEIGYALGISAQTVKNHVTSILRKLAVNDRTQAVVTALRRGWLSIDQDPPSSATVDRSQGRGPSGSASARNLPDD